MAPKPTTDSPVMQFLKTPPSEYRHTDSSSSLQVAAIDEQSTTSKWAHDRLRGVVLRKAQWDWLLEGQYKKFEKFVNKQESPVPVVQEIPFEYPRNEADVGIAIETQVLLPIWSISKEWAPSPALCPSTKALTWTSEFLSEAYMKAPSGQQSGSSDIPMEPQEGSDGPVYRRRAPTDVSDADVHIIIRPNLGGVRVDKICALSYQGFRPPPDVGVETRSGHKSKLGLKALPPRSSNQYLARDQIWGINKVRNEDHLKALVPVELKRHGYIRKTILEEIAKGEYELGTFTPTTAKVSVNHTSLKLNIAILQQAIRYGDHYGARFVMGSSYYESFILDLESIDFHGDDKPRELRWAFVDREHIRLAFAYIYWCACDVVKDQLDKERAAAGKGKGK